MLAMLYSMVSARALLSNALNAIAPIVLFVLCSLLLESWFANTHLQTAYERVSVEFAVSQDIAEELVEALDMDDATLSGLITKHAAARGLATKQARNIVELNEEMQQLDTDLAVAVNTALARIESLGAGQAKIEALEAEQRRVVGGVEQLRATLNTPPRSPPQYTSSPSRWSRSGSHPTLRGGQWSYLAMD